MGNEYKHIILVTDGSKAAEATEQSALDLAKLHQAKVSIVDTVHRPSLAAKLLTSNADDVFAMVVADKQTRLEKVAAVFRDSGIETSVDIMPGKSSEEIARAALDGQADLVIRYMKGEKSRHFSPFGTTARNLMRVCPCPLLLIGDQPVSDPKVMACINAEHDNKENESILAAARALAGSSEKLQALYCWKFYGDDYLGEYMDPATVQGYLDDAAQAYQGIFDHFRQTHELTAFGENVRIENGDPVDVIPDLARDDAVDVVVMSSASQNHPLHRLLGSTVESVLEKLPCALLVVKPLGFKSPIKPTQSNVQISQA